MGTMVALMLLGVAIAVAGVACKPPQRSWGIAAYGIGLIVVSLGAILRWWSVRFCIAWLIFLYVCVLASSVRKAWPDRLSLLLGGVALCYLAGCVAIVMGLWLVVSIAAMLGATAIMLLLDGLGIISETRYWRPIVGGAGALVGLVCFLLDRSHGIQYALFVPAVFVSALRPADRSSRDKAAASAGETASGS